MSDQNLSSFIWSIADLLRGDYKQSEHGKVILPFTVLRRLDCVLGSTKSAVLAEQEKRTKGTKGQPVTDANLRDTENVPLHENVVAMIGELSK